MSTAVNPTPTSVPAASRISSNPTSHAHPESPYTNGHLHHHHDAGAHQQAGAANATKKGKQKKTTDPNEASKLIAAKISQLELGAAEDKEQEAEIGWFCPFLTSGDCEISGGPWRMRFALGAPCWAHSCYSPTGRGGNATGYKI